MPLLNTARFSELSASRQALVRLFQSTNYGSIEAVEVCHGEPVFSGSGPTVFADVRLDLDEERRSELALGDFALCTEVCRLMSLLDQVQKGQISKIEVRAGIPRRVTLQKQVSEEFYQLPAARQAGS
jgi:hypothetical protein